MELLGYAKGRTHSCSQCHQPISPAALQVTSGRDSDSPQVCHFECYRPTRRMELSDFEVSHMTRSVAKMLEEKLAEWISLTYAKVPVSPQKHRLLLIVFEYFSSEEVESILGNVCKEWRTVSRDQDLWSFLYDTEFRKVMDTFQRNKKVQTLTLSCLGIAAFDHRRYKSNYAKTVVTRIIEYAKVRHRKLIDSLYVSHRGEIAEREITEVELVDVEKFYREQRNGYRNASGVVRAVVLFLGKPNNVCMDTQVEEFIQDVQSARYYL